MVGTSNIEKLLLEFESDYKDLFTKYEYISKKKYILLVSKYQNLIDYINNNSNLSDNVLFLANIINKMENEIDKHNDAFIEKQLIKYKQYFDELFKGIDDDILLDVEQRKSIIADEDYSLIIAGAGTGKTTTMAAKVKYLVDIKKVDPSKIVVMSYTRKATEELSKRIQIDFNIPANVITFHSLGMQYIKQIFKNRKCYVVDDNIRETVFYNYLQDVIFPNKKCIYEILENFSSIKREMTSNFIFSNHFIQNYYKYNSFDEYFESYKKYKVSTINNIENAVESWIERKINDEYPKSIQGEIMKSKGEVLIANFLYRNGIQYHYEKIYKEMLDNNTTYKPDFTLEINGEEVYIEYFGLSTYKSNKNSRYERIKRKKEEYHKIHKTKFIKIDYMPGEKLIDNLQEQLIKFGFTLKPKSYEEIFYKILDNNPLSQVYPYKDFLYEMISLIKLSPKRKKYFEIATDYINNLPDVEKHQATIQLKYITDFYMYYQRFLYGSTEEYGFDFEDMVYYANFYIDNIGINNKLNFDYLIIDEYQDISQERYEFTKKVANKNAAKIVAVGDDWQSIFSFAGSKIKYIYNFEKYFDGAKLLKISQTYRNCQDLIDYSGDFIMKNPQQIKKHLNSSKNINSPIKFVPFEDGNEYKVLKEKILEIHKMNPKHSIMILGRTNKIINTCFNDNELKNGIGTKIEYVGHEDIDIDAMTIHKSKGLTCDEVIIIGLNQNFPSGDKSSFWFSYLFKNFMEEEAIPFAEERRLFYVGLTRTKNYVYLLVNKDSTQRSPFIQEIYNIIQNEEII